MRIVNGLSFENIKRTIEKKYLSSYANTEECIAYLVGGWKNKFYGGSSYIEPLIEWFESLNMQVDQSALYKKNPKDRSLYYVKKYYYDVVAFDLKNGRYLVIDDNSKNEIELVDLRSEQEKQCIENCKDYIKDNAIYLLKDHIFELLENKSSDDVILYSDISSFYQTIMNTHYSIQLIPSNGILEMIHKQLGNLSASAIRGNALEFIKRMYQSIVNPITPYHNDLTSLHYACEALMLEPTNYEYKVIILVILLHSKFELYSSNNICQEAIDILPASAFKEKCSNLAYLLENVTWKYSQIIRNSAKKLIIELIYHLFKCQIYPEYIEEFHKKLLEIEL
jgi:hypothetical protein